MLMIDSVCYRKSLIWGCGALCGVLGLGLALVSVSVGTCYFGALCGVCRGEIGRFLACGLAWFGRHRGLWGAGSL